MSEADTLSTAVTRRWGTDCGMRLHPLDAKRTRSKGYGGCMAETGSAIPAAGPSIGGAPSRPRPGAHPFWPGDRAMHGTGSPAVPHRKNPLNLWRNNASEKKSAVEIDSGALWGTVERGKGLAATSGWFGSFPPLNWPPQPPQNRS